MPRLLSLLSLVFAASAFAQAPGALKLTPNLAANIERPLRYRPDGADLVIGNGAEFYFHHREAARLATMLGRGEAVAADYAREAELIARGMRELLWVKDAAGGWFAEYKDLLGLQRVHPSAAVWSFYPTMDAGLPTPREAWSMTRQIDTQIPHLPVRGPGVPAGLHTLASSNWMPYTWSIDNVVMGEAVHTALGFWQAGRADEAWRIAKGSLTAAMFMGISPGNVGSMSFLDVYRRESQRDFADGSGVLSRALVEGLFGARPDALAGELAVVPGWPAEWDRPALRHPDVAVEFSREGATDRFVVEQRFAKLQMVKLRLRSARERVARVTVNGAVVGARVVEGAVPSLEIAGPAVPRSEITVTWTGAERRAEGAPASLPAVRTVPARMPAQLPGGVSRRSISRRISTTASRRFSSTSIVRRARRLSRWRCRSRASVRGRAT